MHMHMVGVSIADDHHGSEGATDAEAAAVLAAIGYKPGPEFEEVAELHRTQSAKSDLTNMSDVSSPSDLKSPGVMMKSPELQNLESPALSEASSDGEDEDPEEDDDGGGGEFEAMPGHVLLQQDEANREAGELEKDAGKGDEGGGKRDDDVPEEEKGDGKGCAQTDELAENIKPGQKASIEGVELHGQGQE